jgi:CelD/BcsL family acetyltransferase involved in cellulose biosynthesis
MRIDVVRPSELGPDELAHWRRIQHSHPDLASPFLSPSFAVAVERARGAARVAVLSDPSGIIGFFPYEQRRWGTGIALAKGLSDVQAVLVPPAATVDVREILRACRLRIWEFDHLLGHQVALLSGAAAGLVPERSPVIDLSDGFEGYQRRQRASSGSFFQSTGRKRRKLEREHGPVRLILADPDHSHLEAVLRWKSAQYRRTGRPDRFANPATRALVAELQQARDPAFSAPLTVLLAGDAVVAGHLGLRSASTLAWWFPAYDPDFGAYSPGLILLLELARAMPEDGLSLLDLGKGDESYKERLSNRQIPLLRGAAARDRHLAAAYSLQHWPRERAERLVLQSPQLRAWAREALGRFGAVRERAWARNHA